MVFINELAVILLIFYILGFSDFVVLVIMLVFI